MTNIVQSKYKICRRLGKSIWGKGKDPFHTKNYVPGQHGPSGNRKATSDYGRQLHEKQLLKGYYGRINERQFRNIYQEASRLRGDTGENLIGLLERRLDAVVYRLNFANSVFAARQLVSHKHVKVNGRKVNIPSYRVKVGDEIELTSSAKEFAIVISNLEIIERDVPDYLELDVKAKKAKFTRVPKLADVPYQVKMNPNLVVEYYSR